MHGTRLLTFISMTRFLLFLLLCSSVEAATIQRIWLSFQREEPTHLTVNWETVQPGDSEVFFGTSSALGGNRSPCIMLKFPFLRKM